MHEFVHACAGAGKTESIIQRCKGDSLGASRLAITLTRTGQRELEDRLARDCPPESRAQVLGWYGFLIHHCIRPYLPFCFPGLRIGGFSFKGETKDAEEWRRKNLKFEKSGTRKRYFDASNRIYRETIEELALLVMERSDGRVEKRLARIFDEVVIDEAQDISRVGLDVIERLIRQNDFSLYIVGDTRQSLLDSSLSSTRNKGADRLKLLKWYREFEFEGLLEIKDLCETQRFNQTIADFADSIFGSDFEFAKTVSKFDLFSGHDGMFLVYGDDIDAYVDCYNPKLLRHSKSSAKHLSHLEFENFGEVKGQTFDRVAIYATGAMESFLSEGNYLEGKSACSFYVAVTRARYSVALLVKKPTKKMLANLPDQIEVWQPNEVSLF